MVSRVLRKMRDESELKSRSLLNKMHKDSQKERNYKSIVHLRETLKRKKYMR